MKAHNSLTVTELTYRTIFFKLKLTVILLSHDANASNFFRTIVASNILGQTWVHLHEFYTTSNRRKSFGIQIEFIEVNIYYFNCILENQTNTSKLHENY